MGHASRQLSDAAESFGFREGLLCVLARRDVAYSGQDRRGTLVGNHSPKHLNRHRGPVAFDANILSGVQRPVPGQSTGNLLMHLVALRLRDEVGWRMPDHLIRRLAPRQLPQGPIRVGDPTVDGENHTVEVRLEQMARFRFLFAETQHARLEFLDQPVLAGAQVHEFVIRLPSSQPHRQRETRRHDGEVRDVRGIQGTER